MDFGGLIGNVLDSAAGQGIDSIKVNEAADLQLARDKRLNEWKNESDNRLATRQEEADTRREGRENTRADAQNKRDEARNKLTQAEIDRKERADTQRHEETMAKGDRAADTPAEKTAREFREQAKLQYDAGNKAAGDKLAEMARVTVMQAGSRGVPSMPTLPPKPAAGAAPAAPTPGPIGAAMTDPPTNNEPPTGAFTGDLDAMQTRINQYGDNPEGQAQMQAALDEQRNRGGAAAPIPQNPAVAAKRAPVAAPAPLPPDAGPIGATLASASARLPDAGGGAYQKPPTVAEGAGQRKTDAAYKADLNQRATQMVALRDVKRLRALIADSREESLLSSTTRKQIYDLLDNVK